MWMWYWKQEVLGKYEFNKVCICAASFITFSMLAELRVTADTSRAQGQGAAE